MSNKDLDSSSGMLNERSPGPSHSTSYNRQRPAIGAFPPRKQSSVAQSIDWVGEEAIANGNSLLSPPPTTFSSARTSLAIGLLKLHQEMDSGHIIAGAEYENLIQVAKNEPWKHMWGLYQTLEVSTARLSADTYHAVMFAAVKASRGASTNSPLATHPAGEPIPPHAIPPHACCPGAVAPGDRPSGLRPTHARVRRSPTPHKPPTLGGSVSRAWLRVRQMCSRRAPLTDRRAPLTDRRRLSPTAGAHLTPQAGFVSDAVDVFHQLGDVHGPPSPHVYVTLISRLLHVKRRGVPNLSLALQLWEELARSGVQLDAASYRAGINAHVEAGRLKEALELIDAMSAAGVRPGRESFNMLIKGYTALGDMESARQVLPLMRKYAAKPDTITFNTLLSGFSHAGDLDMAREVITKAHSYGFPPDVHSFTTLMQGYANARLLTEAEAILTEEMPAANIRPNQHTFGILINGYLRAADVQGARRQVERMAVAGVEMNLTLYNMMLKGYCRAGDEAGSSRTMAELRAAGFVPGTDTYSTIIQAAIRAGDEQLAFKVFSEMKEAGCVIDAAVYTMMMGLYKMRMYETRGSELMHVIYPGSSSPPSAPPRTPAAATPTAAAAAAAPVPPSSSDGTPTNGDGNGHAHGTQQTNGHTNGNGTSSSAPLPSLESSRGPLPALDSSSSPEATSERLSPESPPVRSVPLNSIPRVASAPEATSAAAAVAGLGPESYRRAIATFQAMVASPLVYVDVEAWSALVDVHVVGGDMAAAEEAAAAAASLAASLSQRPPVHAFNALINGYVRLRQLAPALDAFRQFLTLGGVPPRKMCDRVIKLAFFLGDFTAANKAMRAMQLVGVEVDAIRYEEWLQQCQRKVNQRQKEQQRNGGDQAVSDKGFERLKCVAECQGQPEVIIVDGGSTDGTVQIARDWGAKLVQSPRGRGKQLNAGWRASQGDWVLFLHADSLLPPGYRGLIERAITPPQSQGSGSPRRDCCWGCFKTITTPLESSVHRWLVTSGVEYRTRLLHQPYGDQAIFVQRSSLEQLQGYQDWPLLEDVELVRRLRKLSPPAIVDAAIATSARRWERLGFWQTVARNQITLAQWKMGVDVNTLAKQYYGGGK
ncbi:MAG: hypothetical protein WDW36_005322 [Sanguina aurantia]